MNTAIDVLQVSDLGRFHQEYLLRNRPVLIRGLKDRYPIKIFDWSAEYFDRVLGDTKVPVLATKQAFFSYEGDEQQMPFREFSARSFGNNPDQGIHYFFKNSTKVLPDGHDDADKITELASYLQRSVMRKLWMSRGGLTSGLHFDAAENFNFQLRGHKIFTLYPPGVRAYYPLPMFSQTAHISGVYRDGPGSDLSRFPRFDRQRGIDIEVRAGEVLYVPVYWWHQVESLGDENVNLNFWWLPSMKKQLLNWNQALRGHLFLLLRYLKFGNILKVPTQSTKA